MANVAGPKNPTAASDMGGGAGTWTTPANVYTSNASYVSGNISSGGAHTNQLGTTGYGFAIPSTAQILGIQVDFQRYGTAAQTQSVYLMKTSSNVSGSLKAGTDVWPGSEAYVTYGGPTDLWNTAWTPADINASGFGASISAVNTTGGGSAFIDTVRITVYWTTAPSDVPKRYDYKVYRGGLYLGNLPQPSNDFSVSKEINSGGSQITVQVPVSADTSGLPSSGAILDETGAAILDETGDPFLSEGAANLMGVGTGTTVIKSGNEVVVWEYGYYYPNGHVVFSGRMERIEATFGGDAQDNTISVLCYSDGSDLDNFLLLGAPFTYTVDQSQATQDNRVSLHLDSGGAYDFYAQTFTTGASVTNLGGIYLMLDGTATVTVTVYSSTAMAAVLASSTINVSVSGPTEVLFGFANHILVASSTAYFFTVTCASGQSIWLQYSDANPYSSGIMYWATFAGGSGGGTYTATPTGSLTTASDLYFRTASSNGQTTATFTGQDPTTGMLVGFIQDYQSRGGQISTTTTSVQATGLSLNYEFNTNTIYEGIQAILSVAPDGFYYYADIATKILTFKQASTGADLLLTKGVHINRLTIVTSIENVFNVAYFSGGDTGGGVNLYKTYQDAPSIALYGQRLQRISDNHVIDTSTADAIGTSAVASNKDEQYLTTVTVLDKQMDISAITPGMIVGFRGFGSFVDQILSQVVRIDYTPESATLTLGVLPVRLNIELENITRGLIAQETIDNPATPS